jgi:hypothetical protein
VEAALPVEITDRVIAGVIFAALIELTTLPNRRTGPVATGTRTLPRTGWRRY